jgi:hypothetical protein
MPELKRRMIFVSHAWRYSTHYETVVDWFNKAPYFIWSNCSVPSDAALPDKTTKGLKAALTRQINPSQVVVILAGMYAAHSDWIDYEIDEAIRMGKAIVGVRPWGQERTPIKVQNAADAYGQMVGWNSASVIQAVHDLT